MPTRNCEKVGAMSILLEENKMSKEKSDRPSLNYYEPGSGNPIEIDFHEPNEICNCIGRCYCINEKYAIIIKNISDNEKVVIRIPYDVLHIALHQGWGEE